VVDPFVSGHRDLALIGTAVVALGLTLAVNTVPALHLTVNDIIEALS
jgi:hypothetical protein